MTQDYIVQVLNIRINYYTKIINQYLDNLRAVGVKRNDIDELMNMLNLDDDYDWFVAKYTCQYERFAEDAAELIDTHSLVIKLCETLQYVSSEYITPDEICEFNCKLGLDLNESATIH